MQITMPVAPNGKPSSTRLMSSSPPSPRSTSVKHTAPSTAAKMNAVVREVSSSTSPSTRRFNAPFAAASKSAPAAPTPAASVGVARPKKMLPSTARIKSAAGTTARTNAQAARRSIGSTAAAGAWAGFSQPTSSR